MIAPSSLTVALPACFLRASGGALIDYGDIVTHYSVFVKPIFHFFQGARFFFLQCFIHAHFSYYVRHIDTHRQSTIQGHGNTHIHGENRTFSNKTLCRAILAGRLTLQKYYFVAFVSVHPAEVAFCVRYTRTRAGSRCTWPGLAGAEAGQILDGPGLGYGRFFLRFI